MITPQIIATNLFSDEDTFSDLFGFNFLQDLNDVYEKMEKRHCRGVHEMGAVQTVYMQSSTCEIIEAQIKTKARNYGKAEGSIELLYGEGSVHLHTDDLYPNEFATVALVLPLWDYIQQKSVFFGDRTCAFYCAGIYLSLNPGDLFLFDANDDHAWITNYRWMLAALDNLKLADPIE